MSEVDTPAQVSGQYHHTDLPCEELISQIDRLRQEKNAVVLAHNYQTPEVQDIADFTAHRTVVALGLDDRLPIHLRYTDAQPE